MVNIRAFFAIMPPKSISDGLTSVLESSKQSLPQNLLRWVHPQKLHITLQFLKNIQPKDLTPLIEKVRLELKKTPPFQLEFGGLEWFPTAKHPSILSLAVGQEACLMPLSAAIGCAISALNYPVESRPFRGHMSLGRVLHHHSLEVELLQQIKLEFIPPILIDEIYLIESKPSKEGREYYPLARIAL
ncbi:MAG: RNA 2',3'-cyclic phosphodiesterase [Tatlockia sp.]|nr:RNA 2',3'-cyclic phosphodiesterase [Tatlockia sp.]